MKRAPLIPPVREYDGPTKNPAAVSLGSLGGRARAKALSPEARSAIAKKAAAKRWKREAP